jgi:hypothetical protein
MSSAISRNAMYQPGIWRAGLLPFCQCRMMLPVRFRSQLIAPEYLRYRFLMPPLSPSICMMLPVIVLLGWPMVQWNQEHIGSPVAIMILQAVSIYTG